MAADTNKAYNRTKSSRTKGSCLLIFKGLPKLTTELRRFEKERYGDSTPLFECCAPFMIWPSLSHRKHFQGQIYGVADWQAWKLEWRLHHVQGSRSFSCVPKIFWTPQACLLSHLFASAFDKSAFFSTPATWSNYSCTLVSESPNSSMRAICSSS